MKERLLKEPVLIASAIRALLLAVVAFGPVLSADQIAALMVFVEAILALVTRALVTPVA